MAAKVSKARVAFERVRVTINESDVAMAMLEKDDETKELVDPTGYREASKLAQAKAEGKGRATLQRTHTRRRSNGRQRWVFIYEVRHG